MKFINPAINPEITPGLVDRYNACKNIEELWKELHESLAEYGATSIFYGISHSSKLFQHVGIENSSWIKTSHSKEYNEYFGINYYIENDLSAIHCITETTPFIWHDRSQWGNPTEQQLKFMEDSFAFNMGVGVTLPIHFNQHGCGGIGFSTARMNVKEFDLMWLSHKHEVISICYMFDEVLRERFLHDLYSLSARESEVLTWLSLGKPAKGVAAELGISPSTIEKHIRSCRRKLMARNNEQAITKALILGLIQP